MACPSGSDYSDAVQNPSSCFNDPELKRGVVATNSMGLPIVASGQFASVFEVRAGPKRWAVRCFTRQPPNDQVEHYAALTKHLATLRLPMLAEFHHQQNGILIRGRRYPVVKMGWVEGEPLNNFVEIILRHDPKALLSLADRWRSMASELSKHRIAHGDLQHGNVLITKQGEFRLVDYDAMFVPALAGRACPEIGHQHFQHPKRAAKHYDQRLDHFSLLVIYTSLKALASDTSLWSLSNGDSLIFQAADFKQPENSEVFQRLGANREADVRSLSVALRNCCIGKPEAVPPLEQLLTSLPPAPPTPPPGVWGWSAGSIPPSDVPRTGSTIQTPDWAKEAIRWDSPPPQRPTDKKKTVKIPLPPPSPIRFPPDAYLPRWQPPPPPFPPLGHQRVGRPPPPRQLSVLERQFSGRQTLSIIGVTLLAVFFLGWLAMPTNSPVRIAPIPPPTPRVVTPAEILAEAQAAALIALANATKDHPFTNSLGMRFVPVPGTDVLFSVWATRVQDYQAFASATRRSWPNASHEQGPTHPAVNASWEDAQAFAKWLTDKERKEGKLPNDYGYRLPQDWEWSLAVGLSEVRMATPKDQPDVKEVYPWGTQWPPPSGAGNYSKSLNVDNYERTSPVGSFPANSFGLHDMGGNVWQWCQDLYASAGPERVMRGAAFYSNGKSILLSSFRYKSGPEKRDDYSGFRLVLRAHTSLQAGLQQHRTEPPITVATALSKSEATKFTNSLGMIFVPISGTDVLFCVWLTRVRDYQIFVDAPPKQHWAKPHFGQQPSHPAVNVSQEDAQAFCRWLTQRETSAGKLTARQKYRLPLDWEWSVAVGLNEYRAGNPRENNKSIPVVFPWGTQWPPKPGSGNYSQELKVDEFAYTSPVGEFPANRFGLFDMGGNVWQWCEDRDDSQTPACVLRGGSWFNSGSGMLLSSARNGAMPSDRGTSYGFRCVLANDAAQ